MLTRRNGKFLYTIVKVFDDNGNYSNLNIIVNAMKVQYANWIKMLTRWNGKVFYMHSVGIYGQNKNY